MILLAGTRHTCQMVGLQWALQKRNSENAKKGKTFSRSHNRILKFLKISIWLDWASPCGSAGKESACNAGDLGSIPASGRYPGEGKGYLLQYSGLENSRDYIVHRVAKGQNFHFHMIGLIFRWLVEINCCLLMIEYGTTRVLFLTQLYSKFLYQVRPSKPSCLIFLLHMRVLFLRTPMCWEFYIL